MNNNNYTRIYDSSGLQDLLSQALIELSSSSTLASITDNSLVRWDGSVGAYIQETNIILDDSDNLVMPTGSTITFNGTGAIVFTEVGGTDTVKLRAPDSITNAYTLILPSSTGTVGDLLTIYSVDGSDILLEWAQSIPLDTPETTTQNAIVRWDGTTGSGLLNTGNTINSDNTLSMADTSDIIFNGAGAVFFTDPNSSFTGGISPPGVYPATSLSFYLPSSDVSRPEDILGIQSISGSTVFLEWVKGTTGPDGAAGEALFKLQDVVTNNIYGCTGGTSQALLTSGTGGFNNFLAGDNVCSLVERGSKNVCIGGNIGASATHATGCIFLGRDLAPNAPSLGVKNIMIGNKIMSASTANTGTSENIGIGYNVLTNLADGATGNIAVGYNTGELNQGSYNILLGTNVGYATTISSNDNIGIGRNIFCSTGATLTADHNILIGQSAGQTLGGQSTGNICIGKYAGYGTGVQREFSECIFIGEYAGRDCTGGAEFNIAIGNFALGNTGPFNTSDQIAIGNYAMYSVTGPSAQNIGIGCRAAYSLTSGIDNIAIGQRALYSATDVETTGNSRNIAIGTRAMQSADATAASTNQNLGNIAIGYAAGTGLTTGRFNIMLGKDAGSTLTSGTGCICIGVGADVDAGGAVNRIAIGTQATGPNADGGCFLRHRALAASGNQARWSGSELYEDSSSIRFKRDIRNYVDPEDERFDKIQTVWYRPKEGYGLMPNDKTQFAGFIAEELHELYPEYVVYEDKEKTTPRGVDYAHLVVLLIEKMKKLRAMEKEQDALMTHYMKEVEHLLYLADVKNGRIA